MLPERQQQQQQQQHDEQQQQAEQQQLFAADQSTTTTKPTTNAVLRRTIKPSLSSQLCVVRYSMANATEQMDLDTILAELLELEDQLSGAASDQLVYGLPVLPKTTGDENLSTGCKPTDRTLYDVRLTSSSGLGPNNPAELLAGCTSPDGDSAFGDASSADGSSGSSSMGSVAAGHQLYGHSSHSQCFSIDGQSSAPSPTFKITVDSMSGGLTGSAPSPLLAGSGCGSEADERTRKIREALEKMREAKMKKIYIKVFLEDGATKGVLVDERWTVGETRAQIADRVGIQLAADHAIVEECPDLYIARVYEDHEFTVENLEQWATDSKNKIHFRRVADRFNFVERPEDFLVPASPFTECTQWNQSARDALIKRLLDDKSAGPAELEGWLTLKVDGRKSWRRHYFVLRSSGLYYHPKAGKRHPAVKDLQCLMNVYNNQVYVGVDWRKKYKAPTEFGFAVKHPRIQVKNSKYIKYICAEDEATLNRWLAALRVVKNSFKQLYNNYMTAGYRNRSTDQITVNETPRALRVDVPEISDVSSLMSVTPSAAGRLSQISDESIGRIPLRSAPLSPRQFATVGEESLTLMRSVIPLATSDCIPYGGASSSLSANSSRECSPGVFFDKDEGGTIKRQPYGVSGYGSAIVSPCLTSAAGPITGEKDSDEEDFDDEQFPPPPTQCTVIDTPPAPSVSDAPPATARKIPPPPPKRFARTTPRLQQLRQQQQQQNFLQQQHEEQQRQQQIDGLFAELQMATIRQKQKLEQT